MGAVVVTPARQIVATGFNGLPRGFADLPERLQRPVKYDLIVHAELNAIIQCGRNGTSCACRLGATRRTNSISWSVVSTSLKRRRGVPHMPCCSACVSSCTSTTVAHIAIGIAMPPGGVVRPARTRR